MSADVAKYMKYYDVERLHLANAVLSPIDLEIYFRKESSWGDQNPLGTLIYSFKYIICIRFSKMSF